GEPRARGVVPAGVGARRRSPPASLRALAAVLLAPLAGGAVAVHALAGDDEAEAEYSRVALSWTLHYAGAVLSFAGAAHWGLQLAEFGVPRKSDYMALYYLSRFSGPVVFVLFGWLGSVLSTASPQEGSMWLLCGWVGLLSSDFLVWKYEMAPPWWLRCTRRALEERPEEMPKRSRAPLRHVCVVSTRRRPRLGRSRLTVASRLGSADIEWSALSEC
ncbi:unnamed protein product, partial [Prorocentrum cordatum]